MSVNLQDNAEKYIKRFAELAEKARYLLSSQILADSNKHAKMDTGELIFSSQRSSDLPNGLLVWNTPYARRQYYTGTPSHDRNPDAELMWVHVARDRYKGDWKKLFANLAKQEILG